MKRIILGLTLLAFLTLPFTAQASIYDDDFNDAARTASLWTAVEPNPDPSNVVELLHQNDRLEFFSYSAVETNHPSVYLSNWSFALNDTDDFGFAVQYNHPESTTGNLGIGMGIVSNLGTETPTALTLMAYNQGGSDYYRFNQTLSGVDQANQDITRSVTSGWLIGGYDASADKIIFGGAGMTNPFEYTGLRGTLGLSEIQLFLGGESYDAITTSGDLFLDDFHINAVPEPVSTTLFVIGSGVFGLAGYRKRKKDLS